MKRSIISRLAIWCEEESTLDRLARLGAPAGEALTEFEDTLSQQLHEGAIDLRNLMEDLSDVQDWREPIDRFLLRSYLSHVLEHAAVSTDAASRISQALAVTDLRHLADTYPETRAMKRHFHLHVGPTNSGKTYNALKSLVAAETGAYAGPLRLLAHEAWERINRGTVGGLEEGKGRACNLLTGEERRVVSLDAGLTACTVEMLPMHVPLDVVVIDEIQMLADPSRGAAWTAAILAIQAREIHLCGEETAIEVVRKLISKDAGGTGDDLTIHRYERLTPLRVASDDESLEGDLGKVGPGDCVVAFSRSGIFALKRRIEQETGKRCAVVYGALPPETRAEQARLFNEPGNGVDILVASDAVGMGLNLRIKRIIFETLRKYDGTKEVPLSDSQVKQIAGRAGRYGQATTAGSSPDANSGLVTTLEADDLPALRAALASPPKPIPRAYLDAPLEAMEALSMLLLPTGDSDSLSTMVPYATLLQDFREFALVPRACAYSDVVNASKVAELLAAQEKDLSLDELATFSRAPVASRDESVVSAFNAYVSRYVADGCVETVDALKDTGLLDALELVELAKEAYPATTNAKTFRPLPPAIVAALPQLESLHRALVLYVWLSFRLELAFPGRAEAIEHKERAEDALEFLLERLPGLKRTRQPRRRNEGLDLPTRPHSARPQLDWLSRDDVRRQKARDRLGGSSQILPPR